VKKPLFLLFFISSLLGAAACEGGSSGTETIETFVDECPSFVMFSTGPGEDLVEEQYGQPTDELANLVESYVNP
jgi:hypothetical protein